MLNTPFSALIIGAGGAIGSAFVRALQADELCQHVSTVSRSQGTGFDLCNAASIATHAQQYRAHAPYQLIVDATGALSINERGPEKSMSAINAHDMAQALMLNTIGPALVLQAFAPLLAQGDCVYAKLSARVGSIADNRKGGWYSYRASKAAMNMVLQTAAIEIQRKNPSARVVALQPGTVRSALSAPFTKTMSPMQLQDADTSVAGMLSAIKQLPAATGAQFIDYKGQAIPW